MFEHVAGAWEFASSHIDPMVVTALFRVGAAAILCGLIGFERQAHNKDAGIRTYSMVGVGAALFTLLSLEAFDAADTSRVAAQVVSGIGFLGAGLIFRQGATVRGMTTAAGLWSAAAVGMAAGAGAFAAAITTALIILAVLVVTRAFVGRVKARSVRSATVRVVMSLQGPVALTNLTRLIGEISPDLTRPIPDAGHWVIGMADDRPTLTVLLTDDESERILPILRTHPDVISCQVEDLD